MIQAIGLVGAIFGVVVMLAWALFMLLKVDEKLDQILDRLDGGPAEDERDDS